MSPVNIFTSYDQKENRFTNGLISIFQISTLDDPVFLTSFLRREVDHALVGKVNSFHVLKEIKGTADGEFCGKGYRVQFETKIVSGSLRPNQIRAHLKHLQGHPEKLKRLVLLTPDDSNSRYIKNFLELDPTHILHISWKHVYDSLENYIKSKTQSPFTELVRQFLEHVREMVFEQDLAGIILKIHFGEDSGVSPKEYLTELKKGKFNPWNTPREYKSLDGTGRKLLLYDKTRLGITAEVEIKNVKRVKWARAYPWANHFAANTLNFFEKPIPLSRIRNIAGFEDFGKYRKDRNAFRNITQEQYRQLIG